MAVVSGVDAAVTRVGGDGRVDALLLRAIARAVKVGAGMTSTTGAVTRAGDARLGSSRCR